MEVDSKKLQQLYIGYFGRPCDPSGLDYWLGQKVTKKAFAANMYLQPEFNSVNGNLSTEAQVNHIYQKLFDRDGDAAGLLYWSKQIKSGAHPYIIAEIGVNHEGSISNAKKLIEAAARGGSHAAKFQTYKAEKIASVNSPYYWDLKKEKSKNQFELFKKYDSFNAHHYKELHNHCVKNKIDFLSTPFDVECLRFLDPLLNFYKIEVC